MLNKLYRQKMFPELIPLFLIVLMFSFGSTEEFVEIEIPKTEETKAEGSCVTISCTYNQIIDSNVKLLWFKDPIYDHKLKQFNGTILYSNTDDRPQSPGYSSRVKYITDKAEGTTRSKCDLKINDLHKTDSGNYSLRIIGSDTKYMSKVIVLKVTENPCKVSIEPSEMKTSVKEKEEFSVRCSTSASCPSYPEWFLQKPGQEPEKVTLSISRITQDKVKNEGKKVSNLKFNPTWQDDNMTLFCRPANTQDSCLFRNISLSVEYGPKEVKATVSPGEIEEGDSVTLSCTSRGPNVTFSWFKQGIKKTQQSEWRLDNVKPEDSGDYYCEAENKHGKVQSNKTHILVKYGLKDVRVTSVLKEGDELKLECSVDTNPAPDQFYWYFNDSQLQEETSQILTISSVKPEHSGVYHCTAKNKINAKQSENKVKVSVKSREKIEGPIQFCL